MTTINEHNKIVFISPLAIKVRIDHKYSHKVKVLLLTMFIWFSCIVTLNATEPKIFNAEGFYQQANASYIIGAQIFNDNFIYNPGYSLDLSYGAFLNKNLGIGLGTGYKSFESESFVPIYGEIIGFKKDKKTTPFINMRLGYSYGWDDPSVRIDGYDFSGGILIHAGMGRKIKVNNNYSVLLHWSYQHQFAKMEYDIFDNQNYKETLNYDMIVISVGLIREEE